MQSFKLVLWVFVLLMAFMAMNWMKHSSDVDVDVQQIIAENKAKYPDELFSIIIHEGPGRGMVVMDLSNEAHSGVTVQCVGGSKAKIEMDGKEKFAYDFFRLLEDNRQKKIVGVMAMVGRVSTKFRDPLVQGFPFAVVEISAKQEEYLKQCLPHAGSSDKNFDFLVKGAMGISPLDEKKKKEIIEKMLPKFFA